MSFNVIRKRFLLLVLLFITSFRSIAFTSTVRFSDDFYAAQKYFYAQALKKYPKLSKEKFYQEVPIRGMAKDADLKNIMPLMDFFEARQKFVDEVAKYPEQIYPEMFAYLSGHPALKVSAGSKAKFEALEKYFLPFYYTLSTDKHYAFSPDVKTNPCPIVFIYKDEKKNSFSFSLNNTSKKVFSFNLNETILQNYFVIAGKKPIVLKAGGSATIKCTVDLQKLKKDTVFRVFNFIFSDPAQPRVKIIVPVILLAEKAHLSLPAHFYDFTYTYNTHFKNIDLYKDRTSGPEDCSTGNCSGTKNYTLRHADKMMTHYAFGELGSVQYNITTHSGDSYSSKVNGFDFSYNEIGSIDGQGRNCPGQIPESSTPCPPDTPNNGKQLYGARKIEYKVFLPAGKNYNLKLNINYTDLKNQPQVNSELSWLQEKRIMIVITDESQKQVLKEFMLQSYIKIDKRDLPSGTYTVSIFPTFEDGSRIKPYFELSHLNHAAKSRFDFLLKGICTISAN